MKKIRTTLHRMRVALEYYGQLDRFVGDSGISRSAIEKINAGHRNMSRATAEQLQYVYGISADWLLTGSADSEPITKGGHPFNKESYKRHKKRKLGDSEERDVLGFIAPGALPEIVATARAACQQGKLASFVIDFGDSLLKLRKKYGFIQQEFWDSLHFMQKNPEAYFVNVCDDAGMTTQDLEFLRSSFVHNLKNGPGVVMKYHIKRRIEWREDFFKRHPEMRPGAETEVFEEVTHPKPGETVTTQRLAVKKRQGRIQTKARGSSGRKPAKGRGTDAGGKARISKQLKQARQGGRQAGQGKRGSARHVHPRRK